MFAQKQRLDRQTFADTYARGRRVNTPGLTFVYVAASTPQVAAVVGKKAARSAAARNRLRRRLYAALHESGTLAGHLIVIAKPVSGAYSYARLYEEIALGIADIRRLSVGVRSNPR